MGLETVALIAVGVIVLEMWQSKSGTASTAAHKPVAGVTTAQQNALTQALATLLGRSTTPQQSQSAGKPSAGGGIGGGSGSGQGGANSGQQNMCQNPNVINVCPCPTPSCPNQLSLSEQAFLNGACPCPAPAPNLVAVGGVPDIGLLTTTLTSSVTGPCSACAAGGSGACSGFTGGLLDDSGFCPTFC